MPLIQGYLSGGAGVEAIAGLLFSVGVMLMAVDAVGPGLGASGCLGALMVVGCFLPDALAGSLGWGVMLLALIGCALLLLDTRFAGFGVLAWVGVALLLVALSQAAQGPRQFLFTLCAALALIALAMPITLARLPHSRMMGKIELQETLESGSGQPVRALPPVGAEGIACGDLRPIGVVEIDGERYEAAADRFIEKGARVRVMRSDGQRLSVERIP